MTPVPRPADAAARRGGSRPRRRALRWLVPVAAAGVIAVIASGVLSADVKPNLPRQNAAELLASIGNAKTAGFSGTVVEKAALGLPELPNLGGSSSSTGLLSMLSGSHTIRVWYAGETKQRVALLNTFSEQDMFRNGRDLWQWNSDSTVATHTTLPSDAGRAPSPLPTLDPSVAAQRALAMIDPTTSVSTDSTATVAGRATYTLVLNPKDTRSRVGSVRISIDGKTRVPLGVQVYARGSDKPALDISFQQVSFTVPDDDNFTFRPPAKVTVKEAPMPTGGAGKVARAAQAANADMTSIGSGWTTVVKLTGVPSLTELDKQGGPLLSALQPVSGSWGSGRLFSSGLITALITNDGRAYLGAVDPDLLYQAAAQK